MIEQLVEIKELEIEEKTIILSNEIFCKRPYPNHPNGCPNYNPNYNPFCPPNTKLFEKKYDKYLIVYAKLNFKGYVNNRLKDHPDWTDKQAKCVLYWQGSVKKLLKIHLKKYSGIYELYGCGSGFNGSPSMEAVGINVFSTMKLNGIKLELHPSNYVYLVCLLCFKGEIKARGTQSSLERFYQKNVMEVY